MITRHAIRNALLDALEQACENTQEYYALNHCKPAQLAELEEYLVKWLENIGIKFTV
jgi:hypothetical protein